jgi:cardiolipin synthase
MTTVILKPTTDFYFSKKENMSSANKVSPGYSTKNKVTLIRGGQAYFSLMNRLIREATKSIQLQVYILEADETGSEVINNLMNAAKRGVIIQVLVDGYASGGLSSVIINEMRAAGIKLRFFKPIFKGGNIYFGRRLHHKVLVCDGKFGLTGGVNISDRYNDMPGIPAWLDFAVLIEGEAVFELHKLCNQLYAKEKADIVELDRQQIIQEGWNSLNCAVRVRRNDWVMNKNQISATYMEFFRQANKEIVIMSSYFIPSNFFRRNIIMAAKRGVKIKLILAGISDIDIAKDAERYLYRWALQHGITLYEYPKNILHGKVAICDGLMVSIGSYNINDLSALASIELNIDVNDKPFAQHVQQEFEKIIDQDCIPISNHSGTKWNIINQLYHWFAYTVVRFLFRIFTFYFKKKKIKLFPDFRNPVT